MNKDTCTGIQFDEANKKCHFGRFKSGVSPVKTKPGYGIKVIVDQDNFALYFSRSPIPFPRDKKAGARYFKHKGIYAFRKEALLDFYRLPMQFIEATEKIECIRYLEYGKRIKMVETSIQGVEIDTPEDLERAKQLWNQ